jgi:hypothetical protein
MKHRVIAKPDTATWEPEGIEATASLGLDRLFIGDLEEKTPRIPRILGF